MEGEQRLRARLLLTRRFAAVPDRRAPAPASSRHVGGTSIDGGGAGRVRRGIRPVR